MSLVEALAKAAIGIAVAKGLGSVVGGSGGGVPDPRSRDSVPPRSQVPTGSRMPTGSRETGATAPGGGGLPDILGQILGGQGPRGRGSMGSALDELSRISTGTLAKPDFARGGAAPPSAPRETAGRPLDAPRPGSLGDLLDQALNRYGAPAQSPSADQEALAGVLLRALLQAAKADGRIDAGEKQQLMQHLGGLDRESLDLVNAELARPVDVEGLARSVPRGAEAQVYMMSVAGIDLDTQQEARYLQDLARALGIDAATANAIHDRLGEPRLFR